MDLMHPNYIHSLSCSIANKLHRTKKLRNVSSTSNQSPSRFSTPLRNGREKRFAISISAVYTVRETSTSGVTTSTTTTPTTGSLTERKSSLQLAKSSSAMEQLDIERGVCVPFRKYSPETVRSKVLESRGAVLSLMLRGVEIVWNLGLYWSALMYDCLVGRDKEVVPDRARQLWNLV